jgi:hypothetical protein
MNFVSLRLCCSISREQLRVKFRLKLKIKKQTVKMACRAMAFTRAACRAVAFGEGGQFVL